MAGVAGYMVGAIEGEEEEEEERKKCPIATDLLPLLRQHAMMPCQ